MSVDPKSITSGKRYVTASRHIRTVLEVTEDRIRFAYGGSESGGVPQWRWMAKARFADDAVKEMSESPKEAAEPAPTQKDISNGSKPKDAKEPGARKTLTKRQ